jgi:hypothetical protein
MDVFQAEIIQTVVVSSTLLLAFTVFMVTRLLGRRRDARQDPEVIARVADRLDRIEQAVDSIAIEVERISESQRFTSKLLADKAAEQAPGRLPGKQITPH